MFSGLYRAASAAALFLGLAGGQTLAADVLDAPFDWTGIYAGAYAAGGIGTTEAAFGDMQPTGIFGGVDIGAQYQLDRIVIGIEANASLSDLDDDQGDRGTPTFQTQDMDNIGSIHAKLGTPLGERMLVFATAGWGWGKSEYGEGLVEQKRKISGPTLGLGLHYALTDHFIGRAEYVHYFYGDTTYDLAVPTTVTNSADELRIGIDYKL